MPYSLSVLAQLAPDVSGDLAPQTLSILTELAVAATLTGVREQAMDRVVETGRPRLIRRLDGWRYYYPTAT